MKGKLIEILDTDGDSTFGMVMNVVTGELTGSVMEVRQSNGVVQLIDWDHVDTIRVFGPNSDMALEYQDACDRNRIAESVTRLLANTIQEMDFLAGAMYTAPDRVMLFNHLMSGLSQSKNRPRN